MLVIVGMVALIVMFGIAYMLLTGWVASMLWGWFVVPLFGLPQISILGAVGLALIIRLFIQTDFTAASEKLKKEGLAEMLGAMGGWAVAPLFILAAGWVIHILMG